MSYQNPIPQNIVVAAHPRLPDSLAVCPVIAEFLSNLGANVSYGILYDEQLKRRVLDHEFDLMIALGGDGTMMRAGHLCAPLGLPVLGINLGHFGFLMEIQREDWRHYLPRLFEGNYRLEKRMMLRAEHWNGDQKNDSWDVINEVYVGRGGLVRPVKITACVDGYLLTSYIADGLIAATATGSTAYALAVGGPIMPPELRNILVIPVAPHLSVDRAIILPEGVAVTITVNTTHQAVLSVDGQSPVEMEDGDSVRVSAGDHSVSFVRFQDPGYFYRNLTSHMEKNPASEQ